MTIPGERGRRVAVTGLGAAFLAAITVQAAAIAQTWGGWYWAPGCGFAAAVCLAALAGLRRPFRPAVAGFVLAAAAVATVRLAGADLPAEPSPAMALGLAVLTASALRTLSPARAAAVVGAGPVLIVAAQPVAGPPSGGLAAVTALDAPIWLAAVAAGASLRIRDVRARTAAERVRREERLELARELHDVVAHHITGMVLQAQGAQVVARRNPERAAEYLAEMEAAGADALAAMRRVVGLLRDIDGGGDDGDDDAAPASAGPEGLGALVDRFRRRGPEVALSVPDENDWPPEVTTTVYRVAQEALTNVLRHAPQARSVTVTVERGERDVTVEVADDAPAPAAPRPHRGYGLIGMRERVESLGGSLRAGPRPEGGWSVEATLPAGERR